MWFKLPRSRGQTGVRRGSGRGQAGVRPGSGVTQSVFSTPRALQKLIFGPTCTMRCGGGVCGNKIPWGPTNTAHHLLFPLVISFPRRNLGSPSLSVFPLAMCIPQCPGPHSAPSSTRKVFLATAPLSLVDRENTSKNLSVRR